MSLTGEKQLILFNLVHIVQVKQGYSGYYLCFDLEKEMWLGKLFKNIFFNVQQTEYLFHPDGQKSLWKQWNVLFNYLLDFFSQIL